MSPSWSGATPRPKSGVGDDEIEGLVSEDLGHRRRVTDVGCGAGGPRAKLLGQLTQPVLPARDQVDAGAGGREGRAVARPIPDEAPVTTARRPASGDCAC